MTDEPNPAPAGDPPADPPPADPPADPPKSADPPADPPQGDPPVDPAADPGKLRDPNTGKYVSFRELIRSEEARKFAETSPDVSHLADRAVALQKQVSRAIVPPDKDATPEEISAYNKKMGVPDSPDGYDVTRPEHLTDEQWESDIVQGNVKAFREAMHAEGIPAQYAKAALDHYWKFEAAAAEAQVAEDKRYADQSEQELRRLWPGKEFDQNKEYATRAATRMFGDDFEEYRHIETKDGRLLADHPLMLRAMAAVGREMASGNLLPPLSETDAAQLDGQLREIRAKIEDAQGRGDSREANRLYNEEQALIARAKGSQTIVGAQGRAA